MGVAVRWVNRGGGCVLHLPGQLAGYLALPLAALGPGRPRVPRRAAPGPDRGPGRVRPAGLDPAGPARRLPGERPGGLGRRGGEPLDRLSWIHAERRRRSWSRSSVDRRARPRPAGPDPPDVDGVASPAARPDGQGPRGGDPPGRGGLRPGAAPPLHASPPDPPEGRHACLRPEPRLTPVADGPDRRRASPADAPRRRLPDWLKRPIPAARRDVLHQGPDRRAGPGDDLRERQVPEPLGVLDPPDRDVHGPGRDLHPPLRLLRREARQARGRRPRRARPPGRGLRPARPEARRHHLASPATTSPTAAPTTSAAASWPSASGPARRSRS